MNVSELIDPDNVYRQVKVSVGGDGKTYHAADPHFDITGSFQMGPNLILRLPDSVAEHFRQQGRRQLQAEFRDLLNAAKR